ncbi:MAG TPA: DUF2934 domain-containing protein [Bryobacteraceae bacterium]|jgi:hypothetical protein|nr:DUF2934 domain-containing protein [Bryobacteraceae bacterium]
MPTREIDPMEPEDMQQQHEEIARIAYSYWQSRGCKDGHDVEDWLMAEEEMLRRRSPQREERRREARSAA